MAAKKKTVHKPKSVTKTLHKKPEQIVPEVTPEPKPKMVVEVSPPQSHEYTPRLDKKDELNAEEIAAKLEEKQKGKQHHEEKSEQEQPAIPKREVPHIDIPVLEDREETARPAWHTVNDDLPAIAKPTNVPGPIPPSQSLTSAPKDAKKPEPPPARDDSDSKRPDDSAETKPDVMPLADGFMPPDTRKVTVKKETNPDDNADPLSTQDELPRKKSSLPYFFGGIAVGVLVLVAAVWGSVNYTSLVGSLTKQVQPDLTPTPTQAPVAEPVFDRSAVIFEVLNGSGIQGQAAETADTLRELGYTIDRIGNASVRDTDTELYVSEELRELEEDIFKDITGLYPQATRAGVLDDEVGSASARLIIYNE